MALAELQKVCVVSEGAVGTALIVMFVPLLLPVTTGLLDTTLIRYPVPAVAFAGMVILMVPLVVAGKVPMAIGEVKLPVASLS